MGTPGIEIVVGIGIFAAGLVAGILLGSARAGSAALESELREEREKSLAYRDAVAKHFGSSGDMFRDMTPQYATIYAHMAEGARDLSADREPRIGQAISDPALRLVAAPSEDEAAQPEDQSAKLAAEDPSAQASSA